MHLDDGGAAGWELILDFPFSSSCEDVSDRAQVGQALLYAESLFEIEAVCGGRECLPDILVDRVPNKQVSLRKRGDVIQLLAGGRVVRGCSECSDRLVEMLVRRDAVAELVDVEEFLRDEDAELVKEVVGAQAERGCGEHQHVIGDG